jgi:hypothetical protein
MKPSRLSLLVISVVDSQTSPEYWILRDHHAYQLLFAFRGVVRVSLKQPKQLHDVYAGERAAGLPISPSAAAIMSKRRRGEI